MGALDILKGGYEMLTGSGKSDSGGGLFDSITSKFGGNSEAAKEAGEVKESAEKDRASVWGEVGRSMFLRQFPRLSVLKDLTKLGGSKDPEVVPWQHEFEAITALLVLVPNKWKHVITDFFADSTIFQKLVEYWPGLDGINLPIIGKDGFMSKNLPILGKGGSLRDRILQEKDPDAVVEAIRIMHQDIFVTGKVTFDWVREKLGLGGAIATLAGGAGAVALGSKLLDGDSGGGIIDKGKEMLGLGNTPGGKGKKIIDLVKAHPEAKQTTMQGHLISLMQDLNVLDSAEIVKGKWEGNNDEVTASFIYDNAKYFIVFDDDDVPPRTNITVNTSDGKQIAKFRDWGSFDSKDDAKDIIKAIQKNPAPQLPAAAPANDGGSRRVANTESATNAKPVDAKTTAPTKKDA